MRIENMIEKEQKISQGLMAALNGELFQNLLPVYPKTNIFIR